MKQGQASNASVFSFRFGPRNNPWDESFPSNESDTKIEVRVLPRTAVNGTRRTFWLGPEMCETTATTSSAEFPAFPNELSFAPIRCVTRNINCFLFSHV
ncbi:hypothetical protein L596_025209 [Steinernema carpocapsae]|uniref:Uncharacterized protein n=1 Tax=Steinernema carpocapsae TaxID=34508 RepID=A0A4U5M745_STECR|nr:hypothetical protein L596_025209 [Steinernema carpocapsae]